MVDANLRILINAVDKASPQLKGITGALQGIAGSVGAYALAGAAITTVADFTRKAVEETQKYNLEMVDLARKMGTTTEEASRLVQVGDDLRISQASISTAMTFAIRNGIEPSIDGIAKLADQYNALSSPVEKGQLLLKSFGRNGMEMGKLLEKGGDGIRNMAGSIDDSLVVTAKAAAASEAYYKSIDELNDSITGLKMTLGNAIIPQLVAFIAAMKSVKSVTDSGNNAVLEFIPGINALYGISQVNTFIEAYNKSMLDATAITAGMAAATEDLGIAGFNNALIPAIAEVEENIVVVASGIDTVVEAAKRNLAELNNTDLDFGSKIKAEIDKYKFEQAGGKDLQLTFEAVLQAKESGKITAEQANEMFAQLYVAEQALQTNLDNISTRDAATNIKEELGGSLTEAWNKVENVRTKLDEIPAETKKKLSIEMNAYWKANMTIPPEIMSQILAQVNDLSGSSGGGMP